MELNRDDDILYGTQESIAAEYNVLKKFHNVLISVLAVYSEVKF